MILYGKLNDIEPFSRMPELYAQLKELQKVKPEDIGTDPKKVIVDGDKNYFTLFTGKLKTGKPRLEVHHKAADVHVVYEGVDAVYLNAIGTVEEDGEYIAERDVAFFKGETEDVVHLYPGDFVVVMPEDLHSPLNASHGCETVKKAVGKIFYK